MKLAKTIIIMALSVLLVLSLSYNIFINIIFEINNIDDIKQIMICRELLESLNSIETDEDSNNTSNTDITDEPSTDIPTTEYNKVIFHDEYVKITYTGYEENSLLGPKLNFLIENDSDKNISVSFVDVAINGFAMDLSGGYQGSIRPGNKAVNSITILESEYEDYIENIEYVEFIIHIYDTEKYVTIIDSNVICINV